MNALMRRRAEAHSTWDTSSSGATTTFTSAVAEQVTRILTLARVLSHSFSLLRACAHMCVEAQSSLSIYLSFTLLHFLSSATARTRKSEQQGYTRTRGGENKACLCVPFFSENLARHAFFLAHVCRLKVALYTHT